MSTTKMELAKSLGCSKTTVVNAISELGEVLEGHIKRKGKTDILDDFAASAIADKLSPKFFKQSELKKAEAEDLIDVYHSAYLETLQMMNELKDNHADQVADFKARIKVLLEEIDRQAHEIDRLRSALSEAQAEARQAQAAALELATVPFWQRRAVIKKLLPPAR